jgi:predicted LPLAT superfamily acyltransferase
MQPEWLRYRERGSVIGYRLIVRLARLLGRRNTRALLYPICLYYLLFSRTTPRASRIYLEKVFGRRPRWREVFRHHFYFASALLDRVYLYTGQHHLFDFNYYRREALHDWLDKGQGCIMLSAHLGSFEFMRVHGGQFKVPVNMMMYRENAQKLDLATQGLVDAHERRIITIGPIDALITAKEALDRGEVLAILGDRTVSNERYVSVPFFGQDAAFPAGPFLTAAVLKVPVVLFFCLYRGGNRYELYFESFTDQIDVDRRKPDDLRQWIQRYAARLEHYCRLEPYNWFNFYDFWRPPQTEPPEKQ